MVGKLPYRQVHPDFLTDGKVALQSFRPTGKERRISVDDGDMITPERPWQRYVDGGKLSSGVMAVTDGECRQRNLPVIPKPEPFPEHMEIDFGGRSQSGRRRIAKLLLKDMPRNEDGVIAVQILHRRPAGLIRKRGRLTETTYARAIPHT